MIVVGGGVIGLELGSVYSRLGADVEVVEFASKILSSFDNEVSTLFKKICEKQGNSLVNTILTGLKFHLSNKVIGGSVSGNKVSLSVENLKVNPHWKYFRTYKRKIWKPILYL